MTYEPIFLEEFNRVLEKIAYFENNPHVAVSVSGGPDSLALMCLLNQWVSIKSGKLTALIVDHKLRKESDNECKYVKKIADSKKIDCKILTWSGTKPKSRLMELARKKRYELIVNYCKKNKILHLMIGHHFDDKLETFFMRSSRNGNIVGLSSIPWIREYSHLRIIRPFLNFPKTRLIQTCKYFKYQWLNDPSNKNEKYERVKVRNKIKKLGENKIEELIKKNKFFIKRRVIYEEKISKFFVSNLKFDLFGRFYIKQKDFVRLNDELKVETIKRILTTNSGSEYPPRKKPIEEIIKKIMTNDLFKLTLHSNIITSNRDQISFTRESSVTQIIMKDGIYVSPGENKLWDDRFEVFSITNKIFCSKISSENWDFIKNIFFKFEKRKISFEIIKTLPLIAFSKTYLIPFISSPLELRKNGISFNFTTKRKITSNKFLIIN